MMSKNRGKQHRGMSRAAIVTAAFLVVPAAVMPSDSIWSASMPATAAQSTASVGTDQQASQEKQYLVLGKDLTEEEKKTVLSLLGVTDLSAYTVAYVSNEEEHQQLGNYVPQSTIGSHALSSALIVPGAAGSGIQVETRHITYCTPDMYRNALETAGVKDVHVIVAGPYDISGTAALVGISKLYQEVTGQQLDLTSMDAANAELAVTSQLGQEIGTENAVNLVTEMKTRMTGFGSHYQREQMQSSLEDYLKSNQLTLTDSQKKTLLDLMDKLAQAAAAAAESAAQTASSSVSAPDADSEPDAVPISAPETVAGVVNEQKNTLSDADVYQIRIGYEFDDGSFDEWARGTGTLIAGQYVITSDALADLTTDSSLFADTLQDRGDQYSRIGVNLSDQDTTEQHIKVYVTDHTGNPLSVSDTFHQNGMGCLILSTAVQTQPAVFANTDGLDYVPGTPVSVKYAGQKKDRCDVRLAQGTVGKKPSGSGNGGFQMMADTSDGNPQGAPVFDANGNLIGMAAGKGRTDGSLVCYTAAAMQTFLTSNGIKYQTLSELQNAKDQTQAVRHEEDVESAEVAVGDTSALEQAVSSADGVNRGQYTDSSLSAMDSAVSRAKEILSGASYSQSAIDAAVSDVNGAVSGLDSARSSSNALTTIIAVLSGLSASLLHKPLLLGGLVLLMAVLFSMGRRRKSGQDEQAPSEEAEAEREEDGYSGELEAPVDVTRPQPDSAHIHPVPPAASHLAYREETGNGPEILTQRQQYDPVGSEETTVLSDGYLVRKSTGEQVPLPEKIDKDHPFTIGKEYGKVNYVISGDSTVSRQHASIYRVGTAYYIEDNQSRNHTYVDGEAIQPYRKALLEDGVTIRLSDVEFVFHQNSSSE